MLTPPLPSKVFRPRNLRRERKLWHDGQRHPPSLGCRVCPERAMCGCLRIAPPFYDCLGFCRGDLEKYAANIPTMRPCA